MIRGINIGQVSCGKSLSRGVKVGTFSMPAEMTARILAPEGLRSPLREMRRRLSQRVRKEFVVHTIRCSQSENCIHATTIFCSARRGGLSRTDSLVDASVGRRSLFVSDLLDGRKKGFVYFPDEKTFLMFPGLLREGSPRGISSLTQLLDARGGRIVYPRRELPRGFPWCVSRRTLYEKGHGEVIRCERDIYFLLCEFRATARLPQLFSWSYRAFHNRAIAPPLGDNYPRVPAEDYGP